MTEEQFEQELIKDQKRKLRWFRIEMIAHFTWLIYVFTKLIISSYKSVGAIMEEHVVEWYDDISMFIVIAMIFVSGLRVGSIKYQMTGIKMFLMQVECDCDACVERRKSQLN